MSSVWRVWISKYALTQGVFEKTAEVDGSMAVVRNDGCPDAYYHANDWHLSREKALLRAAEMRDAKIKSLKKQLAKLEAMTFQS